MKRTSGLVLAGFLVAVGWAAPTASALCATNGVCAGALTGGDCVITVTATGIPDQSAACTDAAFGATRTCLSQMSSPTGASKVACITPYDSGDGDRCLAYVQQDSQSSAHGVDCTRSDTVCAAVTVTGSSEERDVCLTPGSGAGDWCWYTAQATPGSPLVGIDCVRGASLCAVVVTLGTTEYRYACT